MKYGKDIQKLLRHSKKRREVEGVNDFVTVGMIAGVVITVVSFLSKQQFGDFKKGISENKAAINAGDEKVELKIEKLEEKTEKDIAEINHELSNIKGDFAMTFLKRDDFFRIMNGVESNIKNIDSKLDTILMSTMKKG